MDNKEALVTSGLQKLLQPALRDRLHDAINVPAQTRKLDIYDPRIGEVNAGASLLVDALHTVSQRNSRQIPLDSAAISRDSLGPDFEFFNEALSGVTSLQLAVEKIMEAAQHTQTEYRSRWQALSQKVRSGEISSVKEQTTQGERIGWSDDRRMDYVWELRRMGMLLALRSAGVEVDGTSALVPGVSVDSNSITNQVMTLPDQQSYLQKLTTS